MTDAVNIEAGGQAYRWREDWAHGPTDHQAHAGWAHHGLAVTAGGELVGFHPGEPYLLVFHPDGTLSRSVPCPVREAHGLTLVREDGTESLWIADNGVKPVRQADGSYKRADPDTPGQVLRVALGGPDEGSVLQRLDTPPVPVYESAAYSPTSVAVDEVRHGGTGEIWVADGYGQSLVHRFGPSGDYRATITGGDGAGHFSCPHAVFLDRRSMDRRGAGAELYVADRSNARVQVYGLDGTFRRSLGEGFLTSPSGFATIGDRLVIAELFAQLAVLDADDKLLGYLGTDAAARERPGWPNALTADGATQGPPLTPGKFNSPHGIATDADGAIYVSEWLVGGRLIKLEPAFG